MSYITFELDQKYDLYNSFLPHISPLYSPLYSDQPESVIKKNKKIWLEYDGNYVLCKNPKKWMFYKHNYTKYYKVTPSRCAILSCGRVRLIEIFPDGTIEKIKSFKAEFINVINRYIYFYDGYRYNNKGMIILDCENLTQKHLSFNKIEGHYTINDNKISFDEEIFKRKCLSYRCQREHYAYIISRKDINLFNFIRFKLLVAKSVPEYLAKKILSDTYIKKNEKFEDSSLIAVYFNDMNVEIPKNTLQSLYSRLINDQILNGKIYLESKYSEYQNLTLEFLDYIQSELIYEKLDDKLFL